MNDITNSSAQNQNEIARLEPSPARYYFGLGSMLVLGLFLGGLAATSSDVTSLARAFMVVLAGGLLALAFRTARSGRQAIVLTKFGLFDTAGRVVAHLDEIKRVDRGLLAFRPSNGFGLTLHARRTAAWAPGLWWRIGKTVGIGGLTPPSHNKAMAELLTLTLADRDGLLKDTLPDPPPNQ